jgi:uncharacterized protein (TIGR00269 family)
MLRFDDRIVVGVSGGKDSMALIAILHKLETAFPKAELTAISIDEGIEGYRREAVKIAEQGCRKLGVEHFVVSFKELFGYGLDEIVERLRTRGEASNGGLTPCAYCGVLRRRALNSAARKLNATKLATGHNLDDETQTILLNILHGNPLRIAQVRPVSQFTHVEFVRRIKPFCEILEKETALYAYLKKIEFQTIPCPYAPAALRNDIRSMLNLMEAKHPGLKYTVYRSAEKLWDSLENSQKTELRTCESCGEPTVNKTCQPCNMLQKLNYLGE